MKHKAFTKNKEKEKNDTIKKLKGYIKLLEKKIKFLEDELYNVVKPVRRIPTKPESKNNKVTQTKEEWRLDFLKRFNKGNKNE